MSPKRSKQHIVDEKGIQLIERFFLEKGWITRRQDKDYGIDLEIEIVSNDTLTGKLFKLQVKSHENIKFHNRIYTEYISIKHSDYWKKFDIPVFLFVVDIFGKKIYCKNTIIGTRTGFKKALKSVPFRISEDAELSLQLSFEEFLYNINHYMDLKNYKNFVLFILTKFESFLFLYSRINCRDCFLTIEKEYANALIKHFEYISNFPNYNFNNKYMPIFDSFTHLIQEIELALIEFRQAIPISNAIFRYYYEIIATVTFTVLSLEYEYWSNVDNAFYTTVKNVRVPKSTNTKDVLDFFSYYYVDTNKLDGLTLA